MLFITALAFGPLAAKAAHADEVPQSPSLSRLGAVRRAVSSNLVLLTKRLEMRRQHLLARAAWQPYSPSLILEADYRKAEADAFGREQVLSYAAGVALKTPIGTTVGASVGMNQGLAPASTTGAQSGYAADGEVSLNVTQPLLRGGWLQGAALPLREAELLDSIQRELFRDELNALIAEVDAAYWDLAVAEADLAIKTRSRDRARQQRDDTGENIRRGILAPGEIYVVEENVVFFEQELLRAEESLRTARRRMAELLALPAEGDLKVQDELAKPELQVPDRKVALD
ncbi:MAG: TolC family protein [Deltaproteobacteria bacterium]|nr:TolC family protein [Deltaproteobacteria bacterium]